MLLKKSCLGLGSGGCCLRYSKAPVTLGVSDRSPTTYDRFYAFSRTPVVRPVADWSGVGKQSDEVVSDRGPVGEGSGGLVNGSQDLRPVGDHH